MRELFTCCEHLCGKRLWQFWRFINELRFLAVVANCNVCKKLNLLAVSSSSFNADEAFLTWFALHCWIQPGLTIKKRKYYLKWLISILKVALIIDNSIFTPIFYNWFKVIYRLFWLSDMLWDSVRANHFQGFNCSWELTLCHRILIFGLKVVNSCCQILGRRIIVWY